MDRSLFGPQSPGDLTTIETVWGDDAAFLPHPLPPTWEFPHDLWPLLDKATSQLNRLEGVGSVLPDPSLLLRPLRDREAIRSSEIEGTYANPKELLLFELRPRESKSAEDPANDWREVLNYRLALQHAEQTELPLCLRLLRELHHILMSGVRGKDQRPGEFRQLPVAIGNSGDQGRFVPPPATSLMEFLDPFETYLHRSSDRFHPLVDCFLCHYQIETIHPFADGNGRVGRLLLSIMIQQLCNLSHPWLHMSEYFESNREEYYNGLFQISTNGAWKTWVNFCLEGVVSQAIRTEQRCRQLINAKLNYENHIQAIGGSLRLQGIIDGVFVSPFIQTTDVSKRFEISYNAAKSDLKTLVSAGILEELPGQYPKTYFAPEIYAIAYEGLG